jgi:hypothetical protein
MQNVAILLPTSFDEVYSRQERQARGAPERRRHAARRGGEAVETKTGPSRGKLVCHVTRCAAPPNPTRAFHATPRHRHGRTRHANNLRGRIQQSHVMATPERAGSRATPARGDALEECMERALWNKDTKSGHPRWSREGAPGAGRRVVWRTLHVTAQEPRRVRVAPWVSRQRARGVRPMSVSLASCSMRLSFSEQVLRQYLEARTERDRTRR